MMKKQLAVLSRLYSLVKPHMSLHVLVAFGAGLAPVLHNLIMAAAIKSVFSASVADRTAELKCAILVFALSITGFFLFNGTMWGLFGSSVAKMNGRIRKSIFSHLLGQPAPAVEQNHSAAVMTLFTSDAQAIENAYGYLLRFSIAATLCGLVATAVMFAKSPVMAGIILATSVLQLVFNALLVKPLQSLSSRIAAQIERASTAMGNLLDGNITIRLYGMQQRELARYEQKSLELAALNKKLSLVEGIIKGGNILGGLAGYLLTIAVGTFLVARNSMNLPDLLYLTQIRGLTMLVVFTISEFSQMVQPAVASAERILGFLDKPDELRDDLCKAESETATQGGGGDGLQV
jgi:ABC-type multidrug transport system fused ATPase/permease subunit